MTSNISYVAPTRPTDNKLTQPFAISHIMQQAISHISQHTINHISTSCLSKDKIKGERCQFGDDQMDNTGIQYRSNFARQLQHSENMHT